MSTAVQHIPQQLDLPAIPAPSESGSIIAMIERAARDPNVDIDKFERLMAMKERVEADAARRAYNDAMAKAQADIAEQPIVRRAKNDHTKSHYARLEDILQVVTPIATKHGFRMSFGTTDSPVKDHYRVTCKLAHASGHEENYQADIPSDLVGSQGKANKTAVQGFGSTMSYGRRYLVLLIFNLALVNEDNDGNRQRAPRQEDEDAPVLSDDQLAQIRQALGFKGVSEDKFVKFVLKVPSLECVYADKFEAVMDMIRKSGGGK